MRNQLEPNENVNDHINQHTYVLDIGNEGSEAKKRYLEIIQMDNYSRMETNKNCKLGRIVETPRTDASRRAQSTDKQLHVSLQIQTQ